MGRGITSWFNRQDFAGFSPLEKSTVYCVWLSVLVLFLFFYKLKTCGDLVSS